VSLTCFPQDNLWGIEICLLLQKFDCNLMFGVIWDKNSFGQFLQIISVIASDISVCLQNRSVYTGTRFTHLPFRSLNEEHNFCRLLVQHEVFCNLLRLKIWISGIASFSPHWLCGILGKMFSDLDIFIRCLNYMG